MEPLGIDIYTKEFQRCPSAREKIRQRKFRNKLDDFLALSSWLAKHRVTTVHACLEATRGPTEQLWLTICTKRAT
jgi:hypothetical protein